MEYPKLEIALLGSVDDRYYFGASCRECKHRSRLSLVALRAKLGPDYRVADIRHRLRCRQCGVRKLTVTYLTPAHRIGSVAAMFDEVPLG